MSTLRILHLEDDPRDAELVEATLAADGHRRATSCASTIARAFEARARAGGFDLILADYDLPSFDGCSAQLLAAELRPDMPFIFVSGTHRRRGGDRAVKDGATDYVLKQRLARLPSAVRRALAEAAERRERRRAEAEVRRLNAELEQRVVERTAELAESERRLQAILDHSPPRFR